MAVGAVLQHNHNLWSLVAGYTADDNQDLMNLDAILEKRDKNETFEALVADVNDENQNVLFFFVCLLSAESAVMWGWGAGNTVKRVCDFATVLKSVTLAFFSSEEKELLVRVRQDKVPECSVKTTRAIRTLLTNQALTSSLARIKALDYGCVFPDEHVEEENHRVVEATGNGSSNATSTKNSKTAVKSSTDLIDIDNAVWYPPTHVVPEIRCCPNLEHLVLMRFDEERFRGPVDLRGLLKLKSVEIMRPEESPIKKSDILTGPLPDQHQSKKTCVVQ